MTIIVESADGWLLPGPTTRFPGQPTRAFLDSFNMFISLSETQSTLYFHFRGLSEETVLVLSRTRLQPNCLKGADSILEAGSKLAPI